jgi:hypothetical protein
MRIVRSKLTYANVIATIALFLALTGGAAWATGKLGKNVVKTKNIAPHAVKNKNLAKNAVKSNNIANNAVIASKIKAGSIGRTQLSPTALGGRQIGEFTANPVPGFGGSTESPPAGTPVPLGGTTTFTPEAGKNYEVMVELSGNPVDQDGAGFERCYGEVIVLANGHERTWAFLGASEEEYFDVYKVVSQYSNSTPLGLLEPGKPVTITAVSVTNGNCGPMTASFKGTLVEIG